EAGDAADEDGSVSDAVNGDASAEEEDGADGADGSSETDGADTLDAADSDVEAASVHDSGMGVPDGETGDAEASSGLIADAAGEADGPGSAEASSYSGNGSCASFDDIDVALDGAHAQDIWVTRLRAKLPAAALAND